MPSPLVSDHEKFFNGLWEEAKSAFGAENIVIVHEIRDRAAFEAFLEEVRIKSLKYKDGTKSRTKRVRIRMQRICTRLSEFVESFAGVADVAKGINQQGGALSYGMLSMLLMLVRNKEDREEKIGSYLNQAKRCLSNLQDWQDIYGHRECFPLIKAILAVYAEIFRFVLSAWRYYNGRSRDRWLSALNPAKYSIQLDLDNLDAVVGWVNVETNKLHHARTEELHRRLSNMDRHQIDEKRHEWRHQCGLIRHRLRSPSIIDPLFRSRQLEEGHQALVEQDPNTYTTMELGTLTALEKTEEYLQWRDRNHGGTILIWALNHRDSGPRSPPWLSPALTEIALNMRHQEEKIIYHVVQSAQDTPYQILSLLICDIIEWDQSFFTSHKYLLDSAWESGAASSSASLISLANELLSQWTSTHPDDHIYIVLDGIDKWIEREEDLVTGLWRDVMEVFLVYTKNYGVKVCLLAEWCERKRDVEHIMRLGATRIGLRDGFWRTVGIRQGDRGVME